MQAIKPFAAAFTGRRLFRPTGRLFRRFSGRFGVKMTAVLAEVLGAHAALIKKCGAAVKDGRFSSASNPLEKPGFS
jgi:hypothetical protein